MSRAAKSINSCLRSGFIWVASAFLFACSPPHEPVNLAGNNWLGYQPFYVAKELNPQTVDELEFSIHSLPSTSNLLRLMSEGQLDGGFMTVDEALIYQQGTNEQLCVAMVTDVSRGGDGLIMRPDWREQPEPLRIAHEATAVGGYMLKRAKQFEVFEGKAIQPSVATLNMHASLFESGAVDGVITFHPVLGRLQRLPSEVIFDSDMIAGEIVDLLVIKKSVWNQRASHIRPKLMQLWQTSVSEFKTLTPEVTRIVSVNTGLSRRELVLALADLELVGATYSEEFNLSETLKSVQQFLLETGLLTKRQSLDYCDKGWAN